MVAVEFRKPVCMVEVPLSGGELADQDEPGFRAGGRTQTGRRAVSGRCRRGAVAHGRFLACPSAPGAYPRLSGYSHASHRPGGGKLGRRARRWRRDRGGDSRRLGATAAQSDRRFGASSRPSSSEDYSYQLVRARRHARVLGTTAEQPLSGRSSGRRKADADSRSSHHASARRASSLGAHRNRRALTRAESAPGRVAGRKKPPARNEPIRGAKRGRHFALLGKPAVAPSCFAGSSVHHSSRACGSPRSPPARSWVRRT